MKQDITQKGGVLAEKLEDEIARKCTHEEATGWPRQQCEKRIIKARNEKETTLNDDDRREVSTVYEPTAAEIALEKQRKKDEDRKKLAYWKEQQIKADEQAKATTRDKTDNIKANNTIIFDDKSFVPELDNENRITGFKVTIDGVKYIYSVKDVEESDSNRALLIKVDTKDSHPAVLLTLEDKDNYKTRLYDIAREKMYPKNKSRSLFSYFPLPFGRRKGGKRKSTKKSKKSTKKSKKSTKKTRKSRK